MYVFNVRQLVDDCGGVSEVARSTGKSRTQPYRWIKTNTVTSDVLARLAYANPELNLHKYLQAVTDDRRNEEVA